MSSRPDTPPTKVFITPARLAPLPIPSPWWRRMLLRILFPFG